jgi:DNA-binding PadR family transcriptional regulator
MVDMSCEGLPLRAPGMAGLLRGLAGLAAEAHGHRPSSGQDWREEDEPGPAGHRHGHRHHRHPHGGPFGPGGPGGPWGAGFGWLGGPGGWAGGRPRHGRPRRGDVRTAILALLVEQPMHGYQVITELGERSAGRWQPSPGSVYPTLAQLEDEGLVRAEESEGRRVFRITDAGRAELDRVPADRREPWAGLADPAGADPAGLRDRMRSLAAAALQLAMAGSGEQQERAGRVLDDARRALYRLLAEDDPEPGPDGGQAGAGEEPPTRGKG